MSVTIAPVLGLWVQFGSFCFLLGANFADLLIIRICLCFAYTWLFIGSLSGSALWPELSNPGVIAVDGLVWSIINLYVLISGITRLLLDEQKVVLNDDEDAFWRMLYRLGGVSRKRFRFNICNHMEVVKHKSSTELDTDKYFFIIYTGSVRLEVFDGDELLVALKEGSGSMFNFHELNLLHSYKNDSHTIKVTVLSETATFFQFSNGDIGRIANSDLKSVWQSLYMCNLARIVNTHYTGGDSFEICDDTDVDPLFLPLEDYEQPNRLMAGSGRALERPFAHIMLYIRQSFTLPWPFGHHPIGLRHVGLPAPPRKVLTVASKKRLPSVKIGDSQRAKVGP